MIHLLTIYIYVLQSYDLIFYGITEEKVMYHYVDDKEFLGAFTMGLVSGSNNLITNATSSNIINALLSLSALNNVTTNTPSGSSTAGEAGKALLPLMKSVGK